MGGVRGRFNRLLASVCAVLAVSETLAVIPASAQTLSAQPQSPPIAPSPAACALHIWPATTAHTTFQGWIRAGAVDGARRGIKGYPDLHANALDTEQQVRLLATIDWRGAFNDPALVVVIHPAPTAAADDRARANRLVVEGASPCYRELIIGSAIVESELFSKQSVRVLALRKRFDGMGAAPVNFSSMSESAVLFSEEDKAAADAGARMDAAVRAAFVLAVNKFAVMQSFH